MKEMALKRRIAALVVAALLSLTGASVTLAAVAGDAQAIDCGPGVDEIRGTFGNDDLE